MLDHVSITVSDMAAAERFYDAIMKTLGVVKLDRRDDWLGYGERARPAYPDLADFPLHAPEAEMAGRRIHRFRVARGRAVAPAIIRRTEM